MPVVDHDRHERPDPSGDVGIGMDHHLYLHEEFETGRPRAMTGGSAHSPNNSHAHVSPGSNAPEHHTPVGNRARAGSALTARNGNMVRMHSGSSYAVSHAARSSAATERPRYRSRSMAGGPLPHGQDHSMVGWMRSHLGPRLFTYVIAYWPPLLGMTTAGYAFTVPNWLMGIQVVVGFSLLHLRLWEGLLVSVSSCAGNHSQQLQRPGWVYKALTALAVLVGLITTVFKVVFEKDGNSAWDDLAFVVFAFGGAACIWMRQSVRTFSSPMGKLPGSGVLLLFGAVATVAPGASAAQLPYMLLFLLMIAFLLWRSRSPDLGIGPRVCLLLVTTTHLATLLMLSTRGSTHEPDRTSQFFGKVGRTVTCTRETTGTHCKMVSRDDSAWTGLHVMCLLFLQMILANVEKQDPKAMMGKDRSLASSVATFRLEPSLKVYAFFAKILSCIRFAVLIVLTLSFPSLAMVPMLLTAFVLIAPPLSALRKQPSLQSEPQEHGRQDRSMSGSESLMAPDSSCVSFRTPVISEKSPPEKSPRSRAATFDRVNVSPETPQSKGIPAPVRLTDRQISPGTGTVLSERPPSSAMSSLQTTRPPVERWHVRVGRVVVCVYLALAMFAFFMYGVLESEFFEIHTGDTMDSTGLTKKASITGIHDETWESVLGLTSRPLCAMAGFLLGLVCLQVANVRIHELRLPPATLRSLRRGIDVLEESKDMAWTVFPPFLALMTILILTLSKVMCHRGYSTILAMGYFVLIALIIIKKPLEERPHWPSWLWWTLQMHAQLCMMFAFLLYILQDVRYEDVHNVLREDVKSCTTSLQDVIRHLTIAMCAWLQSQLLCYTASSRLTQVPSGRLKRFSSALAETATGVAGLPGVAAWIDSCTEKAQEVLDWMGSSFDRIRRIRDEALGLLTLVIALSAAMAPPVDIPSLVLLLIFAVAMLVYNLEDHRERLLIKILQFLKVLTAVLLMLRGIVAWPALELPSDDDGRVVFADDSNYFITLEELGLGRPMKNPPTKEVLLGLTALLAGLTASTLAIDSAEAQRPSSEASSDSQRPSAPGEIGHPFASTLEEGDASPQKSGGDSSPVAAAAAATPIAEEPAGRARGTSVSVNSGSEAAATPKPKRYQSTSSRASRISMNTGEQPWEVAFLSKWAPPWLSNQAHPYFSICLLIVGFTFSIGSATILNAVMILAVISLCSWSSQWVQAGNVVSISTVLIMVVQYIARFQAVRASIKGDWLQRSGLEWSARQVVRHCVLLGICFMQKQLWYRSRRLQSPPRELKCPTWLARHADTVGMAALLVVAVARRHVWSPVLVLSVLPWFRHDSLKTGSIQRWRLRQVRLVIFATLLLQVAARLATELIEADNETTALSKVCRWNPWWVSEVTYGHMNIEGIAEAVEAECIDEWRAWLQATRTADLMSQWLFDFFALLGLGLLQLLLQDGWNTEPVRRKLPRRTMVIMHWWPCVVWFVVLMVSLQGGTLLGLSHLVLLFALSFNSEKTLAVRIKWVQRTRLCATLFLLVGLCAQSPLLPCSRALCHNNGVGAVHRTYMSTTTCQALEEIDVFRTDLEVHEARCDPEQGAHPIVIGHDTVTTLLTQVIGFRRTGGKSLGDGFSALFSQLGLLVAVILATTVQLRIYFSEHYRKRVEEALVEADRSVRLERARRYVHEFHCRRSWEVQAQRVRKRVLRTKLKRTIWTINDILSRPGARAGSSHRMNTKEILQLRLGVGEEESQAVTADSMFGSRLNVAKNYLKLMQQVALGRQREEDAMRSGSVLHRKLVDAEQRGASGARLSAGVSNGNHSTATRKAKFEASGRSQSVATAASLERGSHFGASSSDGHREHEAEDAHHRQRGSWFSRAGSDAAEAVHKLQPWWSWFKRSTLLASMISDYIFIGVDEFSFTVRDAHTVRNEDLHAHRQNNTISRIVWKIIISHAQVLVTTFTVWSFIQNRSVLDAIRIFLVFFLTVWVHPFPPHFVWKILQYYSAGLLVLRTFFNLPCFCSGFGWKFPLESADLNASLIAEESARSPWDPEHTVSFCPVAREVTIDVVLGVAMKSGPSALEEASWFSAVLADHLCLLCLLVHEWALVRSGMWDYVVFDRRSQQVWLVEPEGHDPFTQETRAEPRERSGSRIPGPGLTSEDLREGQFETLHPKLIDYSMRLHHQFIREYERDAAMRRNEMRLSHSRIKSWREHFRKQFTHHHSWHHHLSDSDYSDDHNGHYAHHGEDQNGQWHDGSEGHNHVQPLLPALDAAGVEAAAADSTPAEPNGPPVSTMISEVAETLSIPEDAEAFAEPSPKVGNPAVASQTVSKAVRRWFAPVVARRVQADGTTSSSLLSGGASRILGLTRQGASQATASTTPARPAEIVPEDPEVVEQREKEVAAVLLIQLRVRQWLAQNAWRRELRCDLGHQLVHLAKGAMTQHTADMDTSPQSDNHPGSPGRQRLSGESQCNHCHRRGSIHDHGLGHATFDDRSQTFNFSSVAKDMAAGCTCDLCCLSIDSSESRWTCKECDFHVCENCVDEVLQRGVTMGSKSGTSDRQAAAVKSGISLYTAKYLVGFLLLVYAIFASSGIVNEGRSLQQSILESSFSLWTVLFVSVHLGILISDRIFHKLYYRRQSERASRNWGALIIEYSALGVHFAEVIVLHISILVGLTGDSETVKVNMWNDLDLCVYYIGWMVYLCICFMQEKYGRPVIDMDMLRPMEIETLPMVYAGNLGVWLEQIQAVCFLIHYHLPFVDDLRVIIDWSVMPTSLDLWMYYKVEDAHTSLFRTRHHMFVRRGYFFAERRSSLEKMYSGWCLLFGIIFVILMPMIIFSPIAPFRTSALIQSAPLTLSVVFARPCDESADQTGSCTSLMVQMYKAEPTTYYTFSSSEVQRHQTIYDDLSTDIDVQNIIWPLYSQEPMEISAYSKDEISAWLADAMVNNQTAIKVVFSTDIELDRGSSFARLVHSEEQCMCHPFSTCRSRAWPQGLPTSCRVSTSDASDTESEALLATLTTWWEEHADISAPFRLESLWGKRMRVAAESVRAGSTTADIGVRLSRTCTNCTESWGSLLEAGTNAPFAEEPRERVDTLTALFEVERLTQSSILSGSYGTVIGLYAAVVFVIGRYLREAFMDSSKRAIYEEIPNVGVFLDLAIAVRIARDHRDLRTEFQLYYCLMKVLRSTNLLLTYGGHEVSGYGFARTDACPPECMEPTYLRKHAEHLASGTPQTRPPPLNSTPLAGRNFPMIPHGNTVGAFPSSRPPMQRGATSASVTSLDRGLVAGHRVTFEPPPRVAEVALNIDRAGAADEPTTIQL